jgi:hypothetical protein
MLSATVMFTMQLHSAMSLVKGQNQKILIREIGGTVDS